MNAVEALRDMADRIDAWPPDSRVTVSVISALVRERAEELAATAPPVPFPGDHLAEHKPDGGWEDLPDTAPADFPEIPSAGEGGWLAGCHQLAPKPYTAYECTHHRYDDEGWCVGAGSRHVFAVWRRLVAS